MSAASSIIGQCEECCECLTATVEWDSRSASKIKFGFDDSAFCTTPTNRRWFRLEWHGEGGSTVSSGSYYTLSGARELDPNGGGYIVDNLNQTRCNLDSPCSAGGGCFSSSFTSYYPTCEADGTKTAIGFNPSTYSCGEQPYAQLVNEYTTALLKSNTVAALPSYDNDWNDTAGSYANLSTDELTYSIRESRYRFRFKIPKVGFGTCYKLTWVERFTPEGGGSPTDTAKCAIWDGTTPSGYDPNASSTWPTLPSATPFYFELPVPTADGTTTVENIVAECLRCTACP